MEQVLFMNFIKILIDQSKNAAKHLLHHTLKSTLSLCWTIYVEFCVWKQD